MSKQLPLEIRRNFTIKDQGEEWTLICDVCSQSLSLKKPEKGQKVQGGNIQHLLDHAASHPLPKEEEESMVPAGHAVQHTPWGMVAKPLHPEPAVAEVAEPIIELVPESVEPNSQIVVHVPGKFSKPSPVCPNPYQVMFQANVTKVLPFRDQFYTKYLQVQQNGETYSVVLYAANPKHAALVGTRLIEKYINEKRS